MRFSIALLLALAVAFVTPAEAAATLLSPAEIQIIFGQGKPFTAKSTTGGKILTFTFNMDGTARQSPKGASAATAIIGKWRVDSKGYCSKWGKNAEHCYTVEKNGSHYDVRDSSGMVVSQWTL
jgi:hypothetical protein